MKLALKDRGPTLISRQTKPEGQEMILTFDTIPSTNTYAKEHIGELEDGALVAAWEQTAGRGRFDRKWISPPNVNIYASFVMKKITDPFLATASASLAVLELLKTAFPEGDFFIKWPNDIYAGECKICGVLSERVIHSDPEKSGVIAGMGINVNMTEEDLAAAGQPASSLYILSGRKFNLEKLLSQLAEMLSRCYINYILSAQNSFQEWKKHNFVLGKEIEIGDAFSHAERVFVEDIDENGLLVCRYGNGEVKKLSAGDVRILKEWLKLKND